MRFAEGKGGGIKFDCRMIELELTLQGPECESLVQHSGPAQSTGVQERCAMQPGKGKKNCKCCFI